MVAPITTYLCKPQPHRLIDDRLGFVEPTRSEEDRATSPDQKPLRKYLVYSTTPANRGRKRRFPGSILPRTVVWTNQPHRLIMVDWLEFVEPAPPGRIRFYPRITKSSLHLKLQHNVNEKSGRPGPYRLAGREKSNLPGRMLID